MSNLPRTPRLSNLSTPSNLSSVDQANLYPRPLNPVNRNNGFGSSEITARAMANIPRTPRLNSFIDSNNYRTDVPVSHDSDLSYYEVPGQGSLLPPIDYNYSEHVYNTGNSRTVNPVRHDYETYRNRVINRVNTQVNEVN
jgi:hypothetical protein